jgi:hypothetical protein
MTSHLLFERVPHLIIFLGKVWGVNHLHLHPLLENWLALVTKYFFRKNRFKSYDSSPNVNSPNNI